MRARTPIGAAFVALLLLSLALPPAIAASPKYDISTLAGKAASLHGTAGLQVRFSAFLEEEAGEDEDAPPPGPTDPIDANIVLSSPLDGTSIASPNVLRQPGHRGRTPERDLDRGRPEPTQPGRGLGQRLRQPDVDLHDRAGRRAAPWVTATPGTYYSNDGGATWCCASSDPSHLGTLIPGVTRLTGGQYDAGGDPAVAFDSHGNVFYAGLGFNRTSAPNTVAVNKGTFDAGGALSWGAPVFINQTTAPSTLNDKEWIAVDSHASSPFRDNVYVTWTRFMFNAPQRRLHPVADLLRPLDRRRRDLQRPEVDLRQRPVRPGLAPGRRAGRHALRVLERRDPARVAEQHVRREVDGRRRHLQQAGRDLAADRHRRPEGHGLPGQQLPGRRRGAERRPVRDVDDGGPRRRRREVRR